MEDTTRQQQQEIRSAEIQEIISQVPNGMVRWGMVVLFSVLVSLIGTSWFIQYPDALPAGVVITTSPAPHVLVSRKGGSLVLLKEDNSAVEEGELVAYIKSNARPEVILTLEKELLSGLPLKHNDGLGDLHTGYIQLQKAMQALQNFTTNRSLVLLIQQLKKQIRTYNKMGVSLSQQEQLAQQEYALAYQRFKTDSLLFAQNVLSTLDFNNAKTTWLQNQRTAKNAEAALYNNEVQLNQLHQQVLDLKIKQQEQQATLEQEVQNGREAVLTTIASWKELHLFTASSHGRLTYLNFLETGQHVEGSKPLFGIVQAGGKIVAQAVLPITGSGKVKAGQVVNIRLHNYPFEQYGMLTGTITSIAMLPTEGNYRLIIDVPQELITTQNKRLEFRQQLTGTTEIITEDLRLLERFFYQFRKMLNVR